jgi:hypothetical protein
MIAMFGLTGRRHTIRETVRTLWPHLLLLAIYVGVRLFWKGVPDSGISRFMYGKNVLDNLRIYLSAFYDFWPEIGALIPHKTISLKYSWFIFIALATYNLLRYRIPQVAFGVVFILATLLPALFLRGHFFYYHTYLPAFGAVYLAGLALEDVFALLGRLGLRSPRSRMAFAATVVTVMAIFSTRSVRENERRALDPKTRKSASFVIRRAVIAETAYRDLKAKAGDLTGVDSVEILYGSPRKGFAGHKPRDLYWAFSQGTAFRMFFDRYTIKLTVDGAVPNPDNLPAPGTRIFAYDDYGRIYTYEEVMNAQRKARATN